VRAEHRAQPARSVFLAHRAGGLEVSGALMWRLLASGTAQLTSSSGVKTVTGGGALVQRPAEHCHHQAAFMSNVPGPWARRRRAAPVATPACQRPHIARMGFEDRDVSQADPAFFITDHYGLAGGAGEPLARDAGPAPRGGGAGMAAGRSAAAASGYSAFQ
jgi:hypothetical protein